MLTRISLILIIAASATICGLSLTKIKQHTMRLQRDLATQTRLRTDAEASLATTRTTLAKTEANLRQTQSALQTTSDNLEKAETRIATQTKQVDQLKQDMAKAQDSFDSAMRQQVAKTEQAVKQVGELQAKVIKLEALAGNVIEPDPKHLPKDFASNVVALDPKWHFVVLNAGKSKGAIPNAELLVARNGQLIGKVVIKTVQADSSIANIVPGWELSEIKEGDVVFPPRSES